MVEAFAWEMERVVPERESGEEMIAVLRAEVPLPRRSPVSVVEPVPPYTTERVEVAETTPLIA